MCNLTFSPLFFIAFLPKFLFFFFTLTLLSSDLNVQNVTNDLNVNWGFSLPKREKFISNLFVLTRVVFILIFFSFWDFIKVSDQWKNKY